MAKRRKIGLIYQYNENWIGGTYYIQNLISAVNQLDDARKPKFVVFTSNEKHFSDLKKVTLYPYLSRRDFRKGTAMWRAINRVSSKILNRKILPDYHSDIDMVFPARGESYFKPGQKFLYWIPDFQEHYLPNFFTDTEINKRKNYQQDLVKRAKFIVFSSQSAKHDFNEIYPQNKVFQFVLPFAVTLKIKTADTTIYEKYAIPHKYFICSNQFWKHKNHDVVLDAIAILKSKGENIFTVFTGKEHDSRNPDYFDTLLEKAKQLDIKNNIAFLGFISREDQIFLMQNSLAVVQPSLFEGWSTVVEDAKALKANIIVSGINVHREQLTDYEAKQFFLPNSAQELSICMENINRQEDFVYDYKKQILAFGNSFQQIAEKIIEGE